MTRTRIGSRYVRLIMTFTAGLLLATGAFAQTYTGNIFGTVTDSSGSPLPGSTVTLTGAQAPQTAITDASGSFRFLRLEPGRYTVAAELEGMGRTERSVDMRVGHNVDIGLQLTQTVSEVLTVTAATPVIDRRSVGTGENLQLVELRQVPSARDPWVMLQSVPGVLVDRVNVGGNKSGSQSYFVGKGVERHQTSWNVDGVNVTDMASTGASGFYYDFDSFEEMQVATSGADPRVQTPGVQINLVAKRGTNELRGSGRWFWTDKQLQADPEVPAEATDYLTVVNSIDAITDYGIEAGGPLVRDRLWLWGAYSRNDIDLVPAGEGDSSTTMLDNWNGKINAQLLPTNQANVYYMRNNKTQHGRGLGPSRPIETAHDQSGPGYVLKLEDTHAFGSRFFSTLTLAKINNGYLLDPIGGFGNDVYFDEDGSTPHGSYYRYDQQMPQKQIRSDNSAFVRFAGLDHELKFGFGYRQTPVNSMSAWPGTGNWGALFEDPDENYAAITRPAVVDYGTDYTDFYVGDTMIFGNVTVMAGLRYDSQRASNDSSSVPANPVFPELLPAVEYGGDERTLKVSSLSPRLGATWSIDEKNLVRASYARYVDQLGAGDVGANNPFYRIQYLYFYWNDANGDKRVQRGELGDLFDSANIDPDNPAAGYSVGRVDYDMEMTKTDELVLGYQREIGNAFSVSANYAYRKRTDFLWTTYEKTRGGNDFYTPADYERAGTQTGTLPDGTAYSEPYYRLKAGVPAPLYEVTTNRPDYNQTYNGLELSATRRMIDRWMLRANLTLSDWKQHVGPRGGEYGDPTRQVLGDSCSNCDGSAVASDGGADGYINSRWSFSLNGVYQLPYRINLGAAVLAREGYVIPYYFRRNVRDGFGNKRILLTEFDDNRLDDVINVDLRVGKEFALPGGIGLEVGLDLFNATDERTVLWRDNRMYAAAGNDPDNNWIEELQSPRVWRLGARITF